MSNILYTSTSYGNSAVGASLGSQGFGITAEFDGAQNQVFGSTPGTITSAAIPIGANINAQTISNPNTFSRVYNGGANTFLNGAGDPDGYFGMLMIDQNVISINNAIGALGVYNNAENDWLGNGAALTWHTPNLTNDVYTVIVPTDNVVYQNLSTRIGGVVVWHVPVGSLGLYGQNINLPFSTGVNSGMNDTVASERILGGGFGVILRSEGTSTLFNQTWG